MEKFWVCLCMGFIHFWDVKYVYTQMFLKIDLKVSHLPKNGLTFYIPYVNEKNVKKRLIYWLAIRIKSNDCDLLLWYTGRLLLFMID